MLNHHHHHHSHQHRRRRWKRLSTTKFSLQKREDLAFADAYVTHSVSFYFFSSSSELSLEFSILFSSPRSRRSPLIPWILAIFDLILTCHSMPGFLQYIYFIKGTFFFSITEKDSKPHTLVIMSVYKIQQIMFTFLFIF